jgi:hypothetical protein
MIRELATINLENALRWLQRWVSGSMRDPDWNMTNSGTVEEAFELLQTLFKPKTQELWRYLFVSKQIAKIVQTKKILPVSKKSKFQSFTVSKAIAIREGQEIHGGFGVAIVVSAVIPADKIMFSMQDLFKSKVPEIREAMSALDIWEGQKEIVVKVDKPLKLKTLELL